MAIYIFTIPKAGTYFLAELLHLLGFNNTGYHVSLQSYLDTKRLTLEENIHHPSKAHVDVSSVDLLRRLGKNDVAFGHFPAPLHARCFAQPPRFVCSYRTPRETLVSEFLDFRFRRRDVPWIAASRIANDQDAFVHYLEAHGIAAHAKIFESMLKYQRMVAGRAAGRQYRDSGMFVNFGEARQSAAQIRSIARFLGAEIGLDECSSILERLLATPTKTRTEIRIDRDALWGKTAQAVFAASELPEVCRVARRCGWDI